MGSISSSRLSVRRGTGLRGKRKIAAGGERTGFAAVKEEKYGLCVKANEEMRGLEERAKLIEAELRETKAELKDVKMEVVALREGRDDNGGGGEEERIEAKVVAVPATSTSAETRDRSSGKKRKAAT
ncbi:hypothetical protein TrLO_g11111 [Triparma laevis f. longispina]|uniref:Uncharacterized protein n=1 Tax=Triparma laevis f. longispina TaxID=1714387 RepID=A0A9W7F3C6_9STRA|nr:hypothetical protein TrLO_g11111 [Triparma laevis f. longispina]